MNMFFVKCLSIAKKHKKKEQRCNSCEEEGDEHFEEAPPEIGGDLDGFERGSLVGGGGVDSGLVVRHVYPPVQADNGIRNPSLQSFGPYFPETIEIFSDDPEGDYKNEDAYTGQRADVIVVVAFDVFNGKNQEHDCAS